jgi:hypothetical protein
MGLIGRGVRKFLESDTAHGIAGAAADAIDQTGTGGRAGGVVSGIIRDREKRGQVADIATGLVVPGVRNKIRAGKAAHGLIQGSRGGAGAVSSGPTGQFGQFGHLPPPPGSGSIPAWDAQIPGAGSHQSSSDFDWDSTPPPGRSSQGDVPSWMGPGYIPPPRGVSRKDEWEVPDY